MIFIKLQMLNNIFKVFLVIRTKITLIFIVKYKSIKSESE